MDKFEMYDLNHRVDMFIEQYSKDVQKAKIRRTDIGRFYEPRKLRHLIESKAVFAELRHPYVYEEKFADEREKKAIYRINQSNLLIYQKNRSTKWLFTE